MSGRPPGSGGHLVRLSPRADQGGARLFIGRDLYQAIGSPRRLGLRGEERGELLFIRAGTAYAVAGTATGGQPRIALGVAVCEALHLDPATARIYHAVATSGVIDVFLDRPPTGQLTGPAFRALRKRLGLSQSAMGLLLGMHYTTVQRWERAGTGLRMTQYEALERAKREHGSGSG